MTTEIAVEKFVDLLQRSGIVSGDRLERLRLELADDATGLDSPRKIAEQFVEQGILTPWQADHLLNGKHRGFVLGPYRILKPLGKGGMGQVYLAEHQIMRRQCAVKVLPNKLADDRDQMIERFYREAQAVAALDHKNIVRAYDVNKAMQGSTEIHYLVMEFIDGQDLKELVEEHGTLDYGRAAHFIRQAAEGLEHAHRAGLVHRDVKPANLLVDGSDVVKVLDLGLARFFNDTEQASLTDQEGNTILGTADYLAPEQAMNSSDVDARADIYGLGHTFYFLLMGHPPFPKGSVAQRLLAHQMKTPQPITKKRPDAPRELLAIIDKMTAKQPEARYESAGKVAEALAAWLLDHAEDEELRRQAAFSDSGSHPTLPLRRESTRAAYDPGEETELMLAPLDDERPRRTTTQADSPQQATATDTAPSDPMPSDAKVDTEQEKLDDPYDFVPHEDLPDLGSSGDDAMSSLLASETLPGASDQSRSVLLRSSDSGPLDSSGTRKSGASTSNQSGVSTIVRSPVAWVGAIGTIFVVGLIVVLAVSLGETERPVGDGPAVVSPSPQIAEAGSAPSPEAGSEKEDPAASSGESPLPDATLTDVGATTGPRSVPDTVEQSRPEAAGGSPSSTTQVVQHPPKPSSPAVRPPKPVSPPAVVPPAIVSPAVVESKADRSKRLLAEAEYVSLELVSVSRDPRSKLNMMVRLLATQALERAKLKPASGESTAAVMRVGIETANAGELIGIVVSAQLVCHDPTGGADARIVVWERREQLATVAPHLLKRDSIHTVMRQKVTTFFREFSDDCRAARDDSM